MPVADGRPSAPSAQQRRTDARGESEARDEINQLLSGMGVSAGDINAPVDAQACS